MSKSDDQPIDRWGANGVQKHRYRSKVRSAMSGPRVWAALIAALTAGALAAWQCVAVAHNRYGYNMTGTVVCADGGDVTGVRVIIKTAPLQRSTTWQTDPADPRRATFAYWLPFGGRYRVEVRCGGQAAEGPSRQQEYIELTCEQSKTLPVRACRAKTE